MEKEESQRLREAMKRACEEGDFEKVFELIKGGQDPRHALPGSLMPLHYAAFHGNLGVVRILVEEYDCNSQSADESRCTPLHYACCCGHQGVVKYLVTEQKCDPLTKGNEGNLPLHFACFFEVLDTYSVHLLGRYSSVSFEEPTSAHFEITKFLLKECGCDVTESNKHAYPVTGSEKCAPPLVVHLACRYGTVEFVQFLIEQKNCDPNSRNKDKDTPVHLASKYGNVEILRYLVEVKHCSLVQQNKDGNTPLHLACMFQHFDIVQYLVREQQDLTMVANLRKELPTHTACCNDSLEIVKLVTSPSNVTAKAHHNGATPLHVASAYGLLQVVKWLIEELHCDPNIEDDDSLTPLHCVCGHVQFNYLHHSEGRLRSRHIQIAEYFVANCGCDPMMNYRESTSFDSCWPPVQEACQKGLWFVKALTSNNVNCNPMMDYRESTSFDSCWPLMQVACRKDLELVKALTSYNVNCVDKYGNTPLHLACAESKLKVVQFLVLERHCRQDIQNDRGELPLHIACSQVSVITHNKFLHMAIKTFTPEHVRLLPEVVPPELATLPLELVSLPLELVKLVSTDCDINAQTKGGDTPVHIACKLYQIDKVTYLTEERHCNLNIANNEGELPLHIACWQNSLEMVKLVSSCDLHAQTKRGFTAMHIACKINAIEIVEYLVQEKHWKLKPKLYDNLLIHFACAGGSAELVRKLANFANVNTRFPNVVGLHSNRYNGSLPTDEHGISGNIPLHEACKNENVEVVRILLKEFHCDQAIRNLEGELPLHLACRQRSLEIVELVSSTYDATIQNRAGDTPLHIACERGELEIVRYLTEKCVCDLTIQNKSNKLAVHYACEHSLGMVQLVSDCDLESRTSDGATPLHIACLHRNQKIVQYLIEEKKCNPDVENSDGLFLLDCACDYTAYNRQHSYPKKELDDERRQAQAAVIRYLMNKCDYDVTNVLSLFIKACKEGNLEVAKLLCTNIDTVNSSDAEGNTPLHIACMYNHFELVKFLTEDRQCTQNVKNQRGELPLHIACDCSKQASLLETVKLVSSKSNVNAQTILGDTPLHYACYSGVVEVVQFLTEQCQCDQTIQNIQGELPLHIACEHSLLEVVKLVCDCNVNAQTIKEDTPLYIAINSGYKRSEVAEFLVYTKGADPSVLNGCNNSAIHEACRIGDLALVKVLTANITVNCKDQHGNTPLHIACGSGRLEVARFLLNDAPFKADPSIQNCHGNLALHLACESNSLALTKLVSSCSDPNVKNSDGNTPLHVACQQQDVRCIMHLVKERGCDVSVQNLKSELPLHIAARTESFNAVKLVGHCKVNSTTASGYTPLHIACIESNKNIVKYLLNVLNCNPDIQTSSGDTALHLICKTANCWKDKDLLRYLLKKKHCNPDTQNANGETPLHIACQKQDLQTVKLIGSFVRNPNLATSSGDTALHVACKGTTNFEIDISPTTWSLYTTRKEMPPAINIVRYLVMTKNCDQTIANNKGELPLHLACSWSLELVKLVSNCNTNSQTVDGNTPLHIACKGNKMDIVKYLTETKNCDTNIQNEKGELPLHIACTKGNLEMAILVCNCNVNAVTTAGDTPLHLALSSYDENAVKFLISKGQCDLTLQNDDGKLPFHIACEKHSITIIQLVDVCDDADLQTVSGDSPLHLACRRGNKDIVDYLVKVRHCNLRVHNNDNELPLHIACETSTELGIVKLVCDSNVDIQTLQSGDTPLHYACRNKHCVEKIVKHLVQMSNPSIRNNNGQLPLHIVCSNRNISFKLVELLSNCDVNCRTFTGDTPLHEVCKVNTYYSSSNERKQVVQFLVENKRCDPNCQNNAGMTPLHYTCKQNAKEIVLYLLSTGKVGPSVTAKNSDGQTPVMLTDDIEIIRELLKHGADPHPLYQQYEKFFKDRSSENPPPTPFNVLVLGNASTGKTTLIESLKAEGELVVQDTSPDAHTAGIIPNHFESKEYGLVTFYDFAGQHEYYASHEAVIQTIARSTPPAIILLVKISESEENIKQEILYWLSFISNQFPTVTTQPHLIIAGSHADVVVNNKDNPNTKMESIIDSIKTEITMSTAKLAAFTTMNCCVSESPGISNLRQHLQKSSKELKDYGMMNFLSHCFYIYLLEYFKDLSAVSLSQITSCLLQKQKPEYHTYTPCSSHYHQRYQSEATLEDHKPKGLLPTKPSEIDSILEELSEKGHVTFLKSSHRQPSWVILNKEALLEDINGTVFAPKGFKQHKNLASSTGVVPFSAISSHFPKHDPNMIVSFLSHLEFCHVIADNEVLNLIGDKPAHSTSNTASSMETYFFFPHLVSIECPQHIWTTDDKFEYKCGWLLWCSEDHHFFTPRFLQVLLLRLAFLFALNIRIKKHRDHPAIQRRCSIWKNGISWLNEYGIEVLVEMREQNQVVAVMMRCIRRSATKIECIRLRSSVLQKILSMKEEFCSTVSTTESFINPDELQYPLRPPQDFTLFSLSDVARSVIMTKPGVICNDGSSFVELEKLLLFEPYNNLGEDILKELFDEKKDRKMKDDFLYDVADQIVREADSEDIDQKKEYFLKLFNPHPTLLQERVCRAPEGATHKLVRIFQIWRDRSTDQSYGHLRRKLDEYSVFCGRNPLVS